LIAGLITIKGFFTAFLKYLNFRAIFKHAHLVFEDGLEQLIRRTEIGHSVLLRDGHDGVQHVQHGGDELLELHG
jgi:hypothetical protein